MKQKLLTFLLLIQVMYSTYAQGYFQTAGSPASSMYTDGVNVGIGTTTPSGTLHLSGSSCSDPVLKFTQNLGCQTAPYYITAEHIAPGPTWVTDFAVNHKGQVGIGTGEPGADLHIVTKGYASALYDDLLEKFVYGVQDEDERILMAFINTGDANEPGGLMLINSRNDIIDNNNNTALPKSAPAFGVVNSTDERINFAVFGNGAIATGYPMEIDLQTHAQFDMRALPDVFPVVFNIDQAAPQNTSSMLPSNNPYFRVNAGGNIGIGIAPSYNATVRMYNPNGANNFDLLRQNGGTYAIRFMNPHGNNLPRHIITEQNGDFVIDPGVANGGGNDLLRIRGKVNIGNEAPDGNFSNYQLGVDGDIVAKRVVVQIANWADHVFDENYQLATLAELEAFIQQHRHLPEIPSEKEVLEKGVDTGEMNRLLLKKVEELTLYVIKQQQQIDALKDK